MTTLSNSMTPWERRPVWAQVDLDALRFNTRQLVVRAGQARLMAVVKANAYGHGAAMVAHAALDAGAQGLCVICVDEGVQLRQAGIQAPIWVLGFTPPGQAPDAVHHDLTLAVHTQALADALQASCVAQDRSVSVHVEVETGLNRHGLPPEEAVAFTQALRAHGRLTVEGLFTHFASAEEGDKTFTLQQHQRLMEVARQLPWVPIRHCAATASILDTPQLSMEAVRAGLGLYGYHPAPRCGLDVELRPVLSLHARVARVMDLLPGATVGYGRTWRAEVPSRVALLMVGYADGLPRRLSARAPVLLQGQRASLVGRIAMDMCMVDVGHLPGVQPGDVATLLGQQGNERITADDLATLADSISWEVLAGIRSRVPRRFVRDGLEVAWSDLNHAATPAP